MILKIQLFKFLKQNSIFLIKNNQLIDLQKPGFSEIVRKILDLHTNLYCIKIFKEDKKMIHINAVIYVERDSQKGIIIGQGGKMLKKVGTEARKDIESFFDKKVFLELYVKVEKDWRNKENKLKDFGYQNY